jgi:hypothetical protein
MAGIMRIDRGKKMEKAVAACGSRPTNNKQHFKMADNGPPGQTQKQKMPPFSTNALFHCRPWSNPQFPHLINIQSARPTILID